MNIVNILNTYYWFSQPYIAHGLTEWLWLGIFLFAILLGILIRFIIVKRLESILKKTYRSFSNSFFLSGLFGLLWMFFRQQHVPFLAWRFWLLLIVICFVWRNYYNIKFLIKRYPKIKIEQAEKAIKDKYLPKK
jgi:lipoprotein signal peptidase